MMCSYRNLWAITTLYAFIESIRIVGTSFAQAFKYPWESTELITHLEAKTLFYNMDSSVRCNEIISLFGHVLIHSSNSPAMVASVTNWPILLMQSFHNHSLSLVHFLLQKLKFCLQCLFKWVGKLWVREEQITPQFFFPWVSRHFMVLKKKKKWWK